MTDTDGTSKKAAWQARRHAARWQRRRIMAIYLLAIACVLAWPHRAWLADHAVHAYEEFSQFKACMLESDGRLRASVRQCAGRLDGPARTLLLAATRV